MMNLIADRYLLRVQCIAENCPHYAPDREQPDHMNTSIHLTERAARATARTWVTGDPGHYSATVYGPTGLAIQ